MHANWTLPIRPVLFLPLLFLAGTASALDVIETTPSGYDLGVPITISTIEVIFDRPLDPIPAGAIRVSGVMSGLHDGIVTSSGDTLSFSNGGKPFLPGEMVNVNIRRDVASTLGDTLFGGHYFGFTIASGAAPSQWGPRQGYGAENIPYFIHGGDLDNDGTPDLAVPNEGTNNVSIFLNDSGDGVFTSHTDYGVGQTPSSVFGEDFDNDGWQDLATADINSGTMTVLRNQGDGTFASTGTYAAGIQTRQVHGGDFDGDNDIDLCVTSTSTNEVFIYINLGDGTFSAGVSFTDVLDWPFAIHVADVDKDGDLDIGVACQIGDSLVIMRNDGTGNFTNTGHYRIGNGPWDLNGNDMDGDGDFDFVSVSTFSDRVHMLRNDGTGAYPTRSTDLTGNFPLAVHPADLNGDGHIDMVTSAFFGSTVEVFLNNGAGNLVTDTIMSLPLAGSFSWASDLDGDGDLDLAVVDESIDSLYVFYNGSTPTGLDQIDNLPPLLGRGVYITPNPSRVGAGVRIFWGTRSGPGADERNNSHVKIYSMNGRLVRDLGRITSLALTEGLSWDGRDDRDRPVSSGRYLIMIDREGERRSGSVHIVH